MKIKDLKQGDFFTKKDYGTFPSDSQVWVRDYYDRESKKYVCYKWDDANRFCLISGKKDVFTEIVF